MQNDVERTMKFLLTFATFATLWCTLSCYIYSKPYDGPQGRGFVSCLRRTPFLKWFFQQPQQIQQQQLAQATESETQSLTQNHVTIEMTTSTSEGTYYYLCIQLIIHFLYSFISSKKYIFMHF